MICRQFSRHHADRLCRQRRGFCDGTNSANGAPLARFRFMGAGCIHPGQVTIVHEEYTPTADEVEFARKIISSIRRRPPRSRSWSLDGR